MKNRLLAAAAFVIVFALLAGAAAEAAEIKVLSSYGMRAVMLDVVPRFEKATGHMVAIEFATPRVIAKSVADAEAADVVISAGGDLAKGQVLPESITAVARTVMGVAVRTDAPKPDISSPDAVKRALLAAKSVSYDDGLAAVHFTKVLDNWGIADDIKRKTTIGSRPPRRVGDLVASGEVEIGVYVISLLIGIPGIEVVGPLPEDLQHASGTNAAVMAGARDAEAAKALIDFLRTPDAAAVIRAKGMKPAAP
ncbi:MAG: substrate-binding domain-containing protein [Betaproteobacteria bacterium]|nr:substrate-binding domain-containing protein [Betaproteobacteria bacterium]